MFDQEKIGKFVAEMRREQNLTQKQLAEMVGVSDKTVSKWETGRSLPDNAIMMDVCLKLQISVNELLSGERLPEEHYIGKAEENMLELVKENEKTKKNNWSYLFSSAIGFLILVLAYVLSVFSSGGVSAFSNFFDMSIIIGMILVTFGILLAAGNVKDFLWAFPIAYSRKIYEREQIESAKTAIKTVMISLPFSGGFLMTCGLVAFFTQLSDPATIGPNLAVVLLAVFYSCVAELLLIPTAVRLGRK